MNRLEPNLLLAAATGFALTLLVATATVFGRPDWPWRYVATALVSVAAYLAVTLALDRWSQAPRPPLVSAEAPSALAWGAILPLVVLTAAAAPLLLPGVDMGLPVLIGAIFFGLTVRSAIRVRRA